MLTNNKSVIVVIGIGRLGASIAKELSIQQYQVLAIDKDEKSFNKLDGISGYSGFTLMGDASDISFIRAHKIDEAKTIIVATDDDNANIFIAYMCFFVFNVPNILIRLYDSDKRKLLEKTTIKAIYPFELSMDVFKVMKQNWKSAI